MMPERRPPVPRQNRRAQDDQLAALSELIQEMDREYKESMAALGMKMAAMRNEIDTSLAEVRDELHALPKLSLVSATWLDNRVHEFPDDAIEARTAAIARANKTMEQLEPLIPTLADMAQRDIDAKAALAELAQKAAVERAEHEQRQHERDETNAHLQLIIITGLVTIFGGGILQFLPKVDPHTAATMLAVVAIGAILMALFWRRTMARVRKVSPPPTPRIDLP